MTVEELNFIGWVAVGADGLPVRPHRSGYSWQTSLTHPPRVYTTEERAKAQSPVGKALKVYVEVCHDS